MNRKIFIFAWMVGILSRKKLTINILTTFTKEIHYETELRRATSSYQLGFLGENESPKIGMPEDVVSVLLGYDFISENDILTSLSLNIHYTYSTKRPITDYEPIKYSDNFYDFNISFYSIWFKHLIISTHFKNIFNKTPILSTYSVAKPFTWEVELGYNF